jgi:prolyl 4-hydroxylase
MSAGLPQEWQQWFYENLARGCQPAQLFDTLSANGFAADLQHALTEASQHFPHLRDQFEQMRTWLTPTNDAPVGVPATPPMVIAPHLFEQAQHSIDVAGHQVRLTVQLRSPAIVCFDDFLTDPECEALISLAEDSGQISRSTVVQDHDGVLTVDHRRSSEQAWFARGQTPLIAQIEARIADVLRYPATHGEGLQVLRYRDGGEYRPHFDFFDPKLGGSAKHLAVGGQRVATLILYLSDVAQGGATAFPDIGLTVRPKRGSALLFANLTPDRQVDRRTLHAGLPVLSGCKYIATKWLREQVYG